MLIGIADDAEGQARLAAFRNGMQELGWTEGHSVGVKNRRPLGCVQYRAASPFRALRLMAFPTVHMQRD